MIVGATLKKGYLWRDGERFNLIYCSKVEVYPDAGISFKDDSDGVLQTAQLSHIEHMTIIGEDD